MCGIYFTASKHTPVSHDLTHIHRRGPDSIVTQFASFGDWTLSFTASVLHLRGQATTPQPITDGVRILCWNGEAFRYDGEPVAGNDARFVFHKLSELSPLEVLAKIDGPWAMVYYDGTKVIYGKDRTGRRSLLRHTNGICLTSVVLETDDKEWHDIEGLFITDLKSTQHFPSSSPAFNLRIEETHEDFLEDSNISAELLSHLLHAIRIRVYSIPLAAQRVAVLFSGGIDCGVIARLIDQVLPEVEIVDLVNVAFEHKGDGFDVPDRITGRRGCNELRQVSRRRWNLIEVNVTHKQADAARPLVRQLMYPNESVMDESIALAFYFAAGGSSARVLFSGLGADEQLGGYSRHQRALSRHGYAALAAEIALDVDRIGLRNLGRDDRVISAHGKEVRYPYLDEQVMGFLASLPVHQKTGRMGKELLRCLAKDLGLDLMSREKKRAIQFGSRTASYQAMSKH